MSATDALTDLKMARDRTLEAINYAAIMRWSPARQQALSKGLERIDQAVGFINAAIYPPEEDRGDG